MRTAPQAGRPGARMPATARCARRRSRPPGWPTGRIAIPQLAPGASHCAELPGLPGPLAWDAEAVLRWRATCDGEVAARSARVPTMRIQRLGPGWPGTAWIALDDRHLSRDFADGRLPHRGPNDCPARVALGWDGGGLRLRAEVRDDAVVRGAGGVSAGSIAPAHHR